MKPAKETFEKLAQASAGNISLMARQLGVNRRTVTDWVEKDPEFRTIIDDCRGRMFDDCLLVANKVALGIPMLDADGKQMGWVERPDGNMLRYLMSTLGKREGFGEELKVESKVELTTGVDIRSWLELKAK